MGNGWVSGVLWTAQQNPLGVKPIQYSIPLGLVPSHILHFVASNNNDELVEMWWLLLNQKLLPTVNYINCTWYLKGFKVQQNIYYIII